MEFMKICRNCCNSGPNLIPIFDAKMRQMGLVKMIRNAYSMNVKETDGFSKQICFPCFADAYKIANPDQFKVKLSAEELVKLNPYARTNVVVQQAEHILMDCLSSDNVPMTTLTEDQEMLPCDLQNTVNPMTQIDAAEVSTSEDLRKSTEMTVD